jgi:hypothetical protein
VALWYAIPHREGFPLGPVSFVCGAAVGDVFPFWALSGLCFFQNGPYVLVIRSQSDCIPASSSYNRSSSYLLDVCLRLDFVAVDTLLLA